MGRMERTVLTCAVVAGLCGHAATTHTLHVAAGATNTVAEQLEGTAPAAGDWIEKTGAGTLVAVAAYKDTQLNWRIKEGVYYVPNAAWNIGFGQTKIKANRARINSSSALQFVDRSIVNSEFNLDRDFGLFGEYNPLRGEGFNLSAKASVTLGEGRNWGSSSGGGLAYTGRVELYPLGRFGAKGDLLEGDFDHEERVRILLAGAYSYNHKAARLSGQRGALMPDGATRNIGSYFVDFILKYRGFAFYTDFMGRTSGDPLFDTDRNAFIYDGCGLNVQTSYLFGSKWEVALRNSTLFPDAEVRPYAGYERWNQTSVAVTRYIIGHSLKVQADASYNHRSRSAADYNRWEIRFQLELGL